MKELAIGALRSDDKTPERGVLIMLIVLGVALGMVVVAPFLGRWRAKVWLKKNITTERKVSRLPRPELHEPI